MLTGAGLTCLELVLVIHVVGRSEALHIYMNIARAVLTVLHMDRIAGCKRILGAGIWHHTADYKLHTPIANRFRGKSHLMVSVERRTLHNERF